MKNATPVRCHRTRAGDRAEARRMLDELVRHLTVTGRLNVRRLAQMPGTPGYRTLCRWLNDGRAPATVDAVERLAIAAGVDLAYLMPDTPPARPGGGR